MKRFYRYFIFLIGLFSMLCVGGTVNASVTDALPEGVPKDAITSNDIYPNAAKNGIFFVNRNGAKLEVLFYGLDEKTVSTVYSTDQTISDIYVGDDIIYMLENSGEWDYEQHKMIYAVKVHEYSMSTGETSTVSVASEESWQRIGADRSGRIYLAKDVIEGTSTKNRVALFSKEGAFLSQADGGNTIYEFVGFDEVNGNFYYRSRETKTYPGTTYSTGVYSLQAGNVTNDTVALTAKNITYLSGSFWGSHTGSVRMLNGQYLGVLAPHTGEFYLLDSNAYSYTDVTENAAAISLYNDSVSLSDVHISNTAAVKFGVVTKQRYIDTDADCRCVLNPLTGNPIVQTDDEELTEYNMTTGEVFTVYESDKQIWRILTVGDTVALLEVDEAGVYYLEALDWKYPTTMTLQTEDSLTVGEGGTAVVGFDTDIKPEYTLESSDAKLLSMDSYGNYCGNNSGKVTITVKTTDGKLAVSKEVTVNAKAISKTRETFTQLTSGVESGNVHSSGLVYTYLFQRADGGLTRAEYVGSKGFVVEDYDGANSMIATRTIEKELSSFGGFYNGADAYYLVFGQGNSEESDSREVVRVVKYSKNWERIGQCSMMGCNTYSPFAAGSLRMTELNGKLYIHTCHTMYASGDGLHHQANMTYVVAEDTMTTVDSYYGIMNVGYGYVSHSFDEYIQNDGEYIYRVDLGDAYPRGIALTKFHKDSNVTKVSYLIPMRFAGKTGDNSTGCSLGGFELSASDCLITGSQYAAYDGEKNFDGAYNAFILKSNMTQGESTVNYLTNYTADSKVSCLAAKLVKLSDHQFLVMWEEYNEDKEEYITRAVRTDQFGNAVSDIATFGAALSDCQPIVLSDGTVSWIAADNSTPILFNINPYDLSNIGNQPEWNRVEKKLEDIKGEDVEIEEGDTVGWLVERDKKGNESRNYVKDQQGLIYTMGWDTATVYMVGNEEIGQADVPDTITLYGDQYKVTEIQAKAFSGCKQLVTSTIGKNVTTIGASAYQNCTALTTVTIGKNVKTIGKSVWKGCTSLKTVTGGQNVTAVGASAWKGCASLTRLPLGQKVKTIGAEAFSGCKALKKITIPKKVTSIGKKAFYNCKALKAVTVKTAKLTMNSVGANAFKGIHKKAVIKVPKKRLKLYKSILKKRGIGKKVKVKK